MNTQFVPHMFLFLFSMYLNTSSIIHNSRDRNGPHCQCSGMWQVKGKVGIYFHSAWSWALQIFVKCLMLDKKFAPIMYIYTVNIYHEMSIPGGKKLPLYLKQKRFQVLSNDIGTIIYQRWWYKSVDPGATSCWSHHDFQLSIAQDLGCVGLL